MSARRKTRRRPRQSFASREPGADLISLSFIVALSSMNLFWFGCGILVLRCVARGNAVGSRVAQLDCDDWSSSVGAFARLIESNWPVYLFALAPRTTQNPCFGGDDDDDERSAGRKRRRQHIARALMSSSFAPSSGRQSRTYGAAASSAEQCAVFRLTGSSASRTLEWILRVAAAGRRA